MDVISDVAVAETAVLREQIAAVKSVIAPNLNDQELQLFAMVAYRSRMDPFARQIHAVKRQDKLTFQTGIDGFRASAEDTGEYRGSDEPEFGPMIDKPFPHPEWARVVVHRQFENGDWLHQACTAYWDEFFPGEAMGFAWKKMPRTMLAKCAEAGAFRRAFPKRFSSVYEGAEMDQAMSHEADEKQSPARAKVAARRAIVSPAHVEEAPAATVLDIAAVPVSTPPAGAAAATPQRCEAMDPYANEEQCQKADGHGGAHRTKNASWN